MVLRGSGGQGADERELAEYAALIPPRTVTVHAGQPDGRVRRRASRRDVLLAALGVVGAAGTFGACSLLGEEERAARAPEPERVRPEPYEPLPAELVVPAAKRTAARTLETLGTWGPGGRTRAEAEAALVALGQAPGLLDQAALLAGADVADAAVLRVGYPQLGGLADRRTDASVMTIVEQFRYAGDGTPLEVLRTTVDVRVSGEEPTWTVDELLVPDLPPAPSAPRESALQVVGSPRILLPAAARADALSLETDERVLTLLLALAERWELSVHVLRSGHPENVYGRDRTSNHTFGRAVDLWAIDGVPVVEQADVPWRAVMEAARELGADEIGGPEDLDRRRGVPPYFTDEVHQDHLHLGFELPVA